MNKNKISPYRGLLDILSHIFISFNKGRRLYIPLILSVIVIIGATYVNMSEYTFFSSLSIQDFKIDMAPSRDVIATEEVSYVDEEATMRKKNAKKRSLGAVFDKDTERDAIFKKNYATFIAKLRTLMSSVQDEERFIENVNKKEQFSSVMGGKAGIDSSALSTLYRSRNAHDILNQSVKIFESLIDQGVVNISLSVLEEYGGKEVTITHLGKTITEENRDFSTLIFLNHKEGYDNADVASYIQQSLEGFSYEYEFTIPFFILPHLKENVIYNKEETDRRIQVALDKVPDVVNTIFKGEHIIEKNVVIKEEAYNRLTEYIANKKGTSFVDIKLFLAFIVYILACYALAFFLFSKEAFGETVERKYLLLLLLMCTAVYLEVLSLSRLPFFSSNFDMIPFLPVTLFAMLFYVLQSKKMAIFSCLLFTLSVLGSSNFNMACTFFSFSSSIAGIAFTRNTGRRIDLIKTATVLSVVQPLILITSLNLFAITNPSYLFLIIGSSLNGFFSGILLLGFLPLLEVALNCPTKFRLIEISDLNSPLMKKMLVTVSGTYSHSMMVATLAENACSAIGANSLLARVGAYYHDIGKMDIGEYFIENQSGFNKHDTIPPRLSATVLRSHVQKSIEKARSLGLPESIIDIIGEHHGNGIIAYFYNKAKEKGDNVDPIDFSYPGQKPRSKESAVVMLADMTEAGCRSLSKHSVPALTKFINTIFKAKLDSGQLDECKLTFQDITIIKSTFIDILSGYYHSRIKYPNQKDEDEDMNPSNTVKQKSTANDNMNVEASKEEKSEKK